MDEVCAFSMKTGPLILVAQQVSQVVQNSCDILGHLNIHRPVMASIFLIFIWAQKYTQKSVRDTYFGGACVMSARQSRDVSILLLFLSASQVVGGWVAER